MDYSMVTGILSFLRKAENLKNTLRSAHTSSGRCESSAEHSWRLCLLVLVMGKFFEDIDADKLLRLAVIHDLGEAVCGDVPAIEQSGVRNKAELERQGMHDLCIDLPCALKAELWEEYETARTQEARIVKGLDKLETIAQHNQGKNTPEFNYTFNLSYGQEYMDFHPLLKQIREILDTETRIQSVKQEN